MAMSQKDLTAKGGPCHLRTKPCTLNQMGYLPSMHSFGVFAFYSNPNCGPAAPKN